MIAIIDYGSGNLLSVKNALARLGARFTVTSDKDVICSADHVILPGIGEASSAMENLRKRGLERLIPTLSQPVLGICIGLQLMCSRSEEGDTGCMGIFDTDVVRFSPGDSSPEEVIKVPHVGWNSIHGLSSPLFDGIEEGSCLYFVHSYYAGICPQTTSKTTYGFRTFSSSLVRDNFTGVQFHPEKSGQNGYRILYNFLNIK